MYFSCSRYPALSGTGIRGIPRQANSLVNTVKKNPPDCVIPIKSVEQLKMIGYTGFQITSHVTHSVIPAKAGICEKRGFLLSQE